MNPRKTLGETLRRVVEGDEEALPTDEEARLPHLLG